MLTHKRVLELLDYDPNTGQLFWRYRRSGVNINREAGAFSEAIRYRIICIDRKRYYCHRIIWFWVTGAWPKKEIDHINRNRADNRIENLREVTRSQNLRNGTVRSDSQIGVRGVTLRKDRYYAVVKVNGKNHYFGSFKTAEEAGEQYQRVNSDLLSESADIGELLC